MAHLLTGTKVGPGINWASEASHISQSTGQRHCDAVTLMSSVFREAEETSPIILGS